jgi:hypothetical protein
VVLMAIDCPFSIASMSGCSVLPEYTCSVLAFRLFRFPFRE